MEYSDFNLNNLNNLNNQNEKEEESIFEFALRGSEKLEKEIHEELERIINKLNSYSESEENEKTDN